MGGATVVQLLQNLGTYWSMWELYRNAAYMSPTELEYAMLQMESTVGFGTIISLVVTAANITGLVFFHMSLWDLYSSCRPRQKVVFLVLSIVLGLCPFFIFACRKCDYGLRPRKAQLPQWPSQNPGWPPQNPGYPQYPGQWPPQNPNN